MKEFLTAKNEEAIREEFKRFALYEDLKYLNHKCLPPLARMEEKLFA